MDKDAQERETSICIGEAVRCSICGRRLTVPKSVERGIGPVCWGRLKRGELKG